MLIRTALIAWAFSFAALTGSAAARDFVNFDGAYEPGSIVVVNAERHLYYVLGQGRAIRYTIAVGTPHEQWTGTHMVTQLRENPGWSPTPSMRRLDPDLPAYVPPGPDNPLGIRAIYLGWSLYRIHGTNEPRSIGRASSEGCFRMLNEDVVHLYERVHIGTPVFVVDALEDSAIQVAEQDQ